MTTSRLLCRAFDCIGALSSRTFRGLCCPGQSRPFENHREQSRHPSSLTLGDNQNIAGVVVPEGMLHKVEGNDSEIRVE